jgi:hypothetical protein
MLLFLSQGTPTYATAKGCEFLYVPCDLDITVK